MNTRRSALLIALLCTITQASAEFITPYRPYESQRLRLVYQVQTDDSMSALAQDSGLALEDIKQSLTRKDTEETRPTSPLPTNKKSLSEVIQAPKAGDLNMTVQTGAQRRSAGETAVYYFNTQADQEWQGDISLSLASSLASARLSTRSIIAGEPFSLSVPTTPNCQSGDYMFTITATAKNGKQVRQQAVSLELLPNHTITHSYHNTQKITITDHNTHGIKSIIKVPQTGTVYGINLIVEIDHPWRSDLQVTLTSPSGTTHTLDKRDEPTASSCHYRLKQFEGETSKGDWTLNITDRASGDQGYLHGWTMEILSYDPQSPSDLTKNLN
ncbi:P/Homo B domain-containing protein [Shewanella aquimarina]